MVRGCAARICAGWFLKSTASARGRAAQGNATRLGGPYEYCTQMLLPLLRVNTITERRLLEVKVLRKKGYESPEVRLRSCRWRERFYTLEFDCSLELVLYCLPLGGRKCTSTQWCHVAMVLRMDTARDCSSQRTNSSSMQWPWCYESVLPGSLRMHSVADRSGCLLCPSNVLNRAPASSLPTVDLDHGIETMPLFLHLLGL